jgi:hypothetical protein
MFARKGSYYPLSLRATQHINERHLPAQTCDFSVLDSKILNLSRPGATFIPHNRFAGREVINEVNLLKQHCNILTMLTDQVLHCRQDQILLNKFL